MTYDQVISFLYDNIDPKYKATIDKHGGGDNVWGVRASDLKILQKKIKKDHLLSLALFDSGISEAMYLAGLIAEPLKMNKVLLNDWAEKASTDWVIEYTVAWVASESSVGYELALEWIESDIDKIATSGWATLRDYVSITPDEALDIVRISSFLDRISLQIHTAPNRVRHLMNAFIISVGSYIPDLNQKAKEIAANIGKVHVNMGSTACKVPDAITYIEKIENAGKIGKKKKTVLC